ncbi:MAG TPA: hypothetical protein VLM37_10545, partial [Fibrobacteraceae bacterium]|nr:hypothetical protein [Fibrobacteraceae bacterium]
LLISWAAFLVVSAFDCRKVTALFLFLNRKTGNSISAFLGNLLSVLTAFSDHDRPLIPIAPRYPLLARESVVACVWLFPNWNL